MLGESIAHEVGHYLGLLHPVAQDFGHWDSLSDTSACTSQAECEAEMSGNLMFPYPVCDDEGTCVPQIGLTDDQARVIQRYVGVDS